MNELKKAIEKQWLDENGPADNDFKKEQLKWHIAFIANSCDTPEKIDDMLKLIKSEGVTTLKVFDKAYSFNK